MLAAEVSPQMRRSISMPVKPLHLEPEILKRSNEKESVFATTDEELSSDGEDNLKTPHYVIQQRSTPTTINAADETTLVKKIKTPLTTTNDDDLPSSSTPAATSTQSSKTVKFSRSIRDRFEPFMSFFRKFTVAPTTTKANRTTKTTTITPTIAVESQQEVKNPVLGKTLVVGSSMEGEAAERLTANDEEAALQEQQREQLPEPDATKDPVKMCNGDEKVTFTLT